MAARRAAADRIARKGKAPCAAQGKGIPARDAAPASTELPPVVKRLILNRPNFRRGWQLAQMAPAESTTTATEEHTMNRKAEAYATEMKDHPAFKALELVKQTPGMGDLLWAVACAIANAEQAYRDAHAADFDWQNQDDRDKAITLVSAAALATALITDRYN
jgi:hypothetical protein